VTSRGPIGSLPEALGVSWIARGPFFHASQPDTVAAGTLAGRGVTVHAALTGPTDTDMSRGFDIPKASADSVARGIFDGVEDGEEDIFPHPMSRTVAESWRPARPRTRELRPALGADTRPLA
jgi:hypothetical protein